MKSWRGNSSSSRRLWPSSGFALESLDVHAVSGFPAGYRDEQTIIPNDHAKVGHRVAEHLQQARQLSLSAEVDIDLFVGHVSQVDYAWHVFHLLTNKVCYVTEPDVLKPFVAN